MSCKNCGGCSKAKKEPIVYHQPCKYCGAPIPQYFSVIPVNTVCVSCKSKGKT